MIYRQHNSIFFYEIIRQNNKNTHTLFFINNFSAMKSRQLREKKSNCDKIYDFDQFWFEIRLRHNHSKIEQVGWVASHLKNSFPPKIAIYCFLFIPDNICSSFSHQKFIRTQKKYMEWTKHFMFHELFVFPSVFGVKIIKLERCMDMHFQAVMHDYILIKCLK